MNKFNKKLLILPIVLVTAVISSSVLVTGTNVAVQSVYRDRANLVDQNQAMIEKIESASSLTLVTAKVSTLGFVNAKEVQIRGGSTESLSMAK